MSGSAIKELDVGDVQTNSNVEFPGASLEPLVGSLLTFDDYKTEDNIIIVEVSMPNFYYKFVKEERAFIGTCEWCTKTEHLKV